jgi:hypothetical protein
VVPALGESVHEAQFLRLHFAALDRGATSLWRAPAAEGAAARPELRGDAVHWELAPGFTARAEPTLAGVELSFLLEQRPAGCGDLYLALELETSLPQLPGTLRFELPSGGGLTIGGVTAIDALGERTAGEIRLAPGGSRLELQVPGEFVDAAAYPLLIDPLIGPSSEVSGTSEAFSPDVAAAPDHGMYLVAYEVAFAATSRDLHARRVDAAGVPVGPVLLLESGSGLGRKPKVAYVRSTGHFVVAWDESATLFHDRDVHARTVLAADGALAGGTIKVASGSDDQFGCQIGGEASTSADRALVIWSFNGTVQRRFVRVLASGSLQLSGAAQFLLGGLTHPVFEPRVSRAGGEVGRWVVTGGEFGLSGGNTVRGLALLLDRQGNELALQGIDTWPNVSSYRGTAVDGDGTQFLVASRPPFGARKLTWTGAALEVGELTALPAATGSGSPAVALAQAEYLVAWEEPVSGLDAELRVVGLETDT